MQQMQMDIFAAARITTSDCALGQVLPFAAMIKQLVRHAVFNAVCLCLQSVGEDAPHVADILVQELSVEEYRDAARKAKACLKGCRQQSQHMALPNTMSCAGLLSARMSSFAHHLLCAILQERGPNSNYQAGL